MDTKKLRQKVLDLAIHGKLVKQDPNDEPASILLDRIRAEKARLVKEGKIKKIKSVDNNKEESYELPKGWTITNVGDLLTNRDSERIPLSSDVRKKQKNKIYDYYGAAGVIDKVENYLFDERLLLIGEDGANLLSRTKDNAFFAEGKYWVNNHAHVLDCSEKAVLDYVAFIINSMNLEDYITGSAQPKLTQDNLNKIPIPLPPLAEQHRIVKAVDELFEQIDIIERSERELEEAANKTRDKLLNLAIQGHLVPQDPNEEPASVLLERIRAEKARLVKEGKLKKKDLEEKPISPDEIPFDIPEGWVWCRFNSLVNFEMGATPERRNDEYWVSGNHPWISISDMKDLQTIDNSKERITDAALQKYFGNRCSPKGTLIMSFKLTIGRVSILGMDATHNEAIISIYPYVDKNNSLRDYLLHFLRLLTSYIQTTNAIKGSTLNSSKMSQMLIPLPPLSEQRRIVTKLEELLQEIDKLKG